MHRRTLTLLAVLAPALCSTTVFAQASAADHGAHHAPGFTDGEVRKIDKDAGKLTLKHGDIPNLDMPPMTMVFQVKDRAWLDQFKAGDKVRFKAEKGPSGLMVTSLEPAP